MAVSLNQVIRLYNGFGQVTADAQSADGAYDVETTPIVQYAYTEDADGVNNSRLVSMPIPAAMNSDYNYGTGGSLNDTISRLDSLSDNTGVDDAAVTWRATSIKARRRCCQRLHPQAGVDLTTTLDDFGRVSSQVWTYSSTTIDGYGYGYDRDGIAPIAKTSKVAAVGSVKFIRMMGYSNSRATSAVC